MILVLWGEIHWKFVHGILGDIINQLRGALSPRNLFRFLVFLLLYLVFSPYVKTKGWTAFLSWALESFHWKIPVYRLNRIYYLPVPCPYAIDNELSYFQQNTRIQAWKNQSNQTKTPKRSYYVDIHAKRWKTGIWQTNIVLVRWVFVSFCKTTEHAIICFGFGCQLNAPFD